MSGPHRPVNRFFLLSLAVVILLLITGLIFAPSAQASPDPARLEEISATTTQTSAGVIALSSSTPAPTIQTVGTTAPQASTTDDQPSTLLSLLTQSHYQLYVYSPFSASLTQLTDTDWSIIDPEIRPDGQAMVFSSNLNGFWDLYLLDFGTHALTNLTQTSQYDGAPSWSPDGRWIAYETYLDGNLEIVILSTVPGESDLIRITEDPGADHSPAWSPDGRYLLFTTNRTGDEEITRTDLQVTQDRFVNMSRQSAADDRSSSWSVDGSAVYWSRAHNGSEQVVRYDPAAGTVEKISFGSRPRMDPSGEYLLILNQTPDYSQLNLVSPQTGKAVTLPVVLPGDLHGITWIPSSILPSVLQSIQSLDPDGVPGAVTGTGQQTLERSGSITLNAIEGVNVPQPYLTSDVVASFNTLRQQVEQQIGWNYMDILENAFLPITQPPSPEMEESWLYTGRAIAVNTAPLYGGWMCVVREDQSGQTYWRIYLKTRYQDGSQGMPIRSQVWDFTTRTSGDTSAYERGGSLVAAPQGYWVDFTALAAQYGWDRVPAVPNWRSYMDGALLNQYVQFDTLSWQAAMRELYPPEALMTATRVPTMTPTPIASP